MRPILARLVLLSAAGCQTSPAPVLNTPDPVTQPASAPASATHVPEGTVLTATLSEELGTGESRVGDVFTLKVKDALVAQNGATVIPAGSVITGLVTGVGKSGEQAAIRLNFTRIRINGISHPFTAQITSTQRPKREPHDTTRAAVVVATTGAVIGTVIGEGKLRDDLIAGVLGAGAGTIISLGPGGTDNELEDGTQITLQTTDRIDFR